MESLFAEEEIDTPSQSSGFIRHSMRSIKDPVHDYSTSSKAAGSAATRKGMFTDDFVSLSTNRRYC
jgi:hypothetical protein